jgi:hypothetical protein
MLKVLKIRSAIIEALPHGSWPLLKLGEYRGEWPARLERHVAKKKADTRLRR